MNAEERQAIALSILACLRSIKAARTIIGLGRLRDEFLTDSSTLDVLLVRAGNNLVEALTAVGGSVAATAEAVS